MHPSWRLDIGSISYFSDALCNIAARKTNKLKKKKNLKAGTPPISGFQHLKDTCLGFRVFGLDNFGIAFELFGAL